jgi:uncharacterized protein
MVAHNLLIPFRRDRKRDLATGDGEALLASKVRQVLLTEGSTPSSSGELPWRTNFGTGFALLKHRPNDAVLVEIARVAVRDALSRWIPRVVLTSVELQSDAAAILLNVRVRQGDAEGAVTVPLRTGQGVSDR